MLVLMPFYFLVGETETDVAPQVDGYALQDCKLYYIQSHDLFHVCTRVALQ